MAFTYTEVATGTSTSGTTLNSGSFTSKRGALYVVSFSEFDVGLGGFGVNCTAVTCDGFVAPATAIEHEWLSAFYANSVYDTADDLYPVSWQIFVARGNGGTDTVTCTCDDSPDAGTGSHNVRVLEIAGTLGVPIGVRQSNTASNLPSTTTNPVALGSAVLPDSECVYLGMWNNSADSATAGTGWTEQVDASWTDTQSRYYVQSEPTPSGAQSGQVSSLGTRRGAAAMLEVRELRTGWGVPI